jgi:hypothetical protein
VRFQKKWRFGGRNKTFFGIYGGWFFTERGGNVALAGLEIAALGTVEVLQIGNIPAIWAGNWQRA